MVVLCEWCYVCYIGSREYLGKGIGEFEVETDSVVDGNCLLCKNEGFPIDRRYKHKKSTLTRRKKK